MNLRDLQYVVAVADHAHFGHAAQSCNVSQPTLSGQIAKLEQELGIEIFDSYFDGKLVLVWNGKRVAVPMPGDGAGTFLDVAYDDVPVAANEREAARRLHSDFLKLVQTVDAERPWLTPNARALDTETIETWMRQRTDSDLAHAILRWYARVGGSGGFETGDASILHLAQTGQPNTA